MSNVLKIEELPYVRIIRFSRVESRNALSADVLDEIERAISTADGTALIFTGTGDIFASGANLHEIAALDVDAARPFARRGQALMARIENLEQSTIAAVNGFCFGGALDLAIACKRRVASPVAKFAHPGTGLGIITGWGGTQRLPRLVGLANSFEMFFTAAAIDAPRALEIGLIDEITDDPLQRALELSR